jgi:5'-nucleotidase
LPADFAPEAVLSGINVGYNASLGFILGSGTIAGAFEGALHGLPAIAFSQQLTESVYEALKASHDHPDEALLSTLRHSATHAARLAPDLIATTGVNSFVVHNVNFPLPCRPESAVQRTIPARVVMPGLFSPACANGNHRLVFNSGQDVSPAGPLTDRAALAAGHISHSILDYTRLGG